MIVGVTGTREPPGGFTTSELRVMQALVNRLDTDDVLCSGGCTGVDGAITRMAGRRGLWTRAYLATDTRQTDWAALEEAETELIRTGLGLLGRNRVMVDQAAVMHAFGLYRPAAQPRSGTWACARYAQRALNTLSSVTVFRLEGARPPYTLLTINGSDYCLCSTARCGCNKRRI